MSRPTETRLRQDHRRHTPLAWTVQQKFDIGMIEVPGKHTKKILKYFFPLLNGNDAVPEPVHFVDWFNNNINAVY